MIDVHQKLLELAKKEYQIALQFCILNDSVSAMNWLKRSASKNYQPAISLIHEMIDKNLIVQRKTLKAPRRLRYRKIKLF